MIYLEVSQKDWNKIQNIIDDEDLYKGESGDEGRKYGKEENPHITILYGIHNDVPDEDVEKLIDDIKSPSIDLQKVSTFDNELFDVLKFDVESEDLIKLNKKFSKLPHTTDYPDYHAHCTICYLKKGTAKKYVDKLNCKPSLRIKPDKIVYSKGSSAEGKNKKTYKLKK